MITGDHPDTARAIARELDILEHGDTVVVGRELDRVDDQELAQRVPGIVMYSVMSHAVRPFLGHVSAEMRHDVLRRRA
jgi:Ca2+-transporting ATPase